jgi:hypothetical protein
VTTKNAERLAELRRLANALIHNGATARHIATELARSFDVIDARIDLTYEIKKAMKNDAREKAYSEASTLGIEHGRQKRQYDALLATLKAQPAESAYGQATADAVAREGAWRRLERTLARVSDTQSKGVEAEKLLKLAHEIGDEATLRAAHVELENYLQAEGEPMPPALGDWLVVQGGSVEGGDAVAVDLGTTNRRYRADMAVNHTAFEINSSDHDHVIIPDVDSKAAVVIPIGTDYRPNVKPGADVPTRVQSIQMRGEGGAPDVPTAPDAA